MDEPLSVGADRIVNVLAAVELFGRDTIVVDFGTATTFDCVTADARFIGGVIMPGLRTAADQLTRRTAKLPATELRAPPHVIGRRTEECIQSGVLYGTADAVDGIVRRIRKSGRMAGPREWWPRVGSPPSSLPSPPQSSGPINSSRCGASHGRGIRRPPLVSDARAAGYRLFGAHFDYLLHLRPAEWPIMAAHTVLGYLLAVGLAGAAPGIGLGSALAASCSGWSVSMAAPSR